MKASQRKESWAKLLRANGRELENRNSSKCKTSTRACKVGCASQGKELGNGTRDENGHYSCASQGKGAWEFGFLTKGAKCGDEGNDN